MKLNALNILSIAASALFAAFFIFLTMATSRFDGVFKPDSVFYIDTAHNLRDGRGLTSSMTILNEAVDAGTTLPMPMTQWGPVYPVAVALASSMGAGIPKTALMLSLVSVFVFLAVLFLLLQRGFGIGAAWLALGALCHFAPLLDVARAALSEGLGLVFCASSLYCVAHAKPDAAKSIVWLAVGGIAGGLAYATRYALLPIAPVCVLACLLERTWRRRVVACVAYGVGYGAVFVPILLRNLYLSGYARGVESVPSQFGLSDVARHLGWVIRGAFVPESPIVQFGYIVLLTLAAVRVLWVWRSRSTGGMWGPAGDFRTPLLLGGFAVAYLVFLVVSELRFAIDPIDARLSLPTTCLALAVCVAVLAQVCAAGRLQVVSASIGLILIAVAANDARTAANRYASASLKPVYDFSAELNRDACMRWIADHTTSRDLIIGEEIIELPLLVGPRDFLFTQIGYPETYAVSWDALQDYLREHAQGHDSVYVVVSRIDERKPGTTLDDPIFLSSIVQGVAGVEHVVALENGDIYRVSVQ